MYFIRKLWLGLGCFLVSLPSSATPMISNQFSELANNYEISLLEHNPELGLIFGKKDVPLDKFMDPSIAEIARWEYQEDNFLLALKNLDTRPSAGTPEYYTYLLLKETLENRKAARSCKVELWDINPFFGWHNTMVVIAEKQPVGTPASRQLALKRWHTFKKVVDEQIKNLTIGLNQGYTAPKPAVDRVLAQLKMMLNTRVEQSPFFDFAQRDGDPLFKEQVADLIKTVMNPALKSYIDFLEYDYRPLARESIGVSALPNGEACYQAKIKQETTLSLTPKEIHKLGLQYMRELSVEVAAIGLKKYGTADMATIFQRAKEESAHCFSSEQDLLNYNFAALDRVKMKIAKWFDNAPKAVGTIKPYPPHRAQTGSPGEYYPPSEDGTEPGIYYINTYEPEKRSRIDQEATLFHELMPGHHFQISLSYEANDIPRINRYLLNSGYGEGWALYAERLADEMDLYSDDISRLGMLSNEAFRAARLVVDTGIHTMDWSREDAITYLSQHTALNAVIIESEVDRYMMAPGQATAYMLGKIEITSLRDLAKERLGNRFDIRKFHHQLLKNGFMSLPTLRLHILSWLDESDRDTSYPFDISAAMRTPCRTKSGK